MRAPPAPQRLELSPSIESAPPAIQCGRGEGFHERSKRYRPADQSHQSPRRREQSIPSAAPAQPGGLVSLGGGGPGAGAAGGQADLPLGGILDLLLVPRHGAGVVLQSGGRGADE